jgi:hypothetical protein
VKERK